MKKIKILIVGKSNVGKSSLINYFTNNHTALVSNKLHSTRISTSHPKIYNNTHFEFIDTPGASIEDNNLLSKAMKSNASKHITSADLIILLTQPQAKYDFELKIHNQIKENNKEYILCVNKTDLDICEEYKDRLLQTLKKSSASFISVKESLGIDTLYELIQQQIHKNNINGSELIDDKKNSIKIIQELIRESVIKRTNKELPYESAVYVSEYVEQAKSVSIKADIIVSKDNHKKIIIGKKGQMIKSIGINSRELIENYLNIKTHLSLFVVVKVNWKNNSSLLKDIGYIE